MAKEGSDSGLARLSSASKDVGVGVSTPSRAAAVAHRSARVAHPALLPQGSDSQLATTFAKGAQDLVSKVQASVEEADAEEEAEQQRWQQEQQQRDRRASGRHAASSEGTRSQRSMQPSEHGHAAGAAAAAAAATAAPAQVPEVGAKTRPGVPHVHPLHAASCRCCRLLQRLAAGAHGKHADGGSDHEQPDTSREVDRCAHPGLWLACVGRPLTLARAGGRCS